MKKFILISILCLFLFACKKETATEANGTIRNFTGLDGCGWVIELDDGNRLEVAINSSGENFIADKRVFVKYKARPFVSICMVGVPAEITVLRYL